MDVVVEELEAEIEDGIEALWELAQHQEHQEQHQNQRQQEEPALLVLHRHSL